MTITKSITMRNIFIISFLIFFITGCNFQSKKQEEIRNLHIQDSLKIIHQQDSILKIKLKLEQRLIQDSINRELEKVAISDIAFGINQKTYKTKEKNFLKSCQHEKYELYYLGQFRFNMKESFEKELLYKNYITKDNEGNLSITEYGREFKRKGGYAAIDKKEKQEDTIREKTIESFRYDKLALIVSIAAIIISIIGLMLK